MGCGSGNCLHDEMFTFWMVRGCRKMDAGTAIAKTVIVARPKEDAIESKLGRASALIWQCKV